MLLQKQVSREASGTKKIKEQNYQPNKQKPQTKLKNRALKQDILPVTTREQRK